MSPILAIPTGRSVTPSTSTTTTSGGAAYMFSYAGSASANTGGTGTALYRRRWWMTRNGRRA